MLSWFKSRKAVAVTAHSDSTVSSAPTLDSFEELLEAKDLAKALEASAKMSGELRRGARHLRLEGWLSYELGNLEDARKLLEQAIGQDATNAHCHALLAATYMRQGNEDRARELAMTAESLGGVYPWLRSMLGVLNHRQGDAEAARDWFRKALEIEPGRRDALEALAAIAFERRDWEDLLTAGRLFVEQYPEEAKGWSYLGTAEARAGSDDAAEFHLVRAVALSECSVDRVRDHASFLVNSGRIHEAKQQLERALERDPNEALLHTAHAQCLLILDGSSKEAWREYEWRLRLPGVAQPRTQRWQGEPLPTGEVHIIGEQGLGDMLLFARMLPEVARRCERVVLEAPAPLVPLFRAGVTRQGWERVEVASSGTPSTTDARHVRHLHFMSLMDVLGPSLPDVRAPYLLPSEELGREWQQRIGQKRGRLRVALVWAGNPLREDDVLRSIPPAALAPLAEVGDAEYISLQKDGLLRYFEGLPVPMLDPTKHVRDFADSAAILRQCDLLLSIDTAAAHLAGACGVPCWVLLPQARDWRWEMGGVEQPWYPSNRTFRVRRNREWLPLIEKVASELNALASTSAL